MSEVQAIESEDEIEMTEGEGDQEIIESEEMEIVIEGDDEPSLPTTVPISSYMKTREKLKGKVSAANQEVEEEKRRAEAYAEENKLLRMKLEQDVTARPKQDDFNSDAEYETALDAYYDKRADSRAAKVLEDRLAQSQTQTSQASQEANLDANLKAHYERAGKLKIDDYAGKEENVMGILGNDIYKYIINNTDNSEVILGRFMSRPDEAEKLAQKIAANPQRGAVEIGLVSAKVQLKPKSKTVPSPEERVESGSAAHQGKRGPKGAKFW